MAATTVTLGAQSWEFDDEKMTLTDAFLIKAGTGLPLLKFQEGLNEFDPVCLQGLVWFLRRKAGETVDIHSIDFALADLKIEQAPDPTPGSETPSESSETD